MTNPIVVAIGSVLTETVALIVGFGLISNAQAGLAIALGTAVVTLGAAIYTAAHAHGTALVKAAQIRAGQPPAGP